MKKLFILLFIASLTAISSLSAANYKLDNAKVDAMFDTAQETSMGVMSECLNLETGSSVTSSVSQKDPVIAVVLAFFLGNLGIHRFYLGTAPMTGVGYILTCGGCGIVSFVDFIVLLLDNKDISKYVDNTKFFMWN